MENKSNKGLIIGLVIGLVICIVALLGLSSYIVYDKLNDKISTTQTNTKESQNNVLKSKEENQKEYKEYTTGAEVKVKLNESTIQSFYVLQNSGSSSSKVTLFSQKNIGTSAFNNNIKDGNDFEGSLIQKILNSLTADWINAKSIRLITVDEIKNTGETYKEQCGPSVEDQCDAIKNNSWLIYGQEMYWTMSKVTDESISNNTNRYVYYVDLNREITPHIVSEENSSAFTNFGIRPVIEISKDYIEE